MEETKKEFTPRPERAERPQRGRRRRKVCAFCVDKVAHVDYKDAGKLKKYMSERGKILPDVYKRQHLGEPQHSLQIRTGADLRGGVRLRAGSGSQCERRSGERGDGDVFAYKARFEHVPLRLLPS